MSNTEKVVLQTFSVSSERIGKPLEFREGEVTILEALENNQVVRIRKINEDCFELEEQCDGEFARTITRDQFLQLIEELKEMAK